MGYTLRSSNNLIGTRVTLSNTNFRPNILVSEFSLLAIKRNLTLRPRPNETNQMSRDNETICLFDVDGTLTEPRKVNLN